MNRKNSNPEYAVRLLAVPPGDPVRRQVARDLAMEALNTPDHVELAEYPPQPGIRWLALSASVAVVAVCALIMMFPPQWNSGNGSVSAVSPPPILSPADFTEICRVFPGQIDAVICGATGIELRIAEKANIGLADQLVRITLCGAGSSSVIFTYSGREVHAEFGGRRLSLTPLVNGEGDVIVLSPDRVYGVVKSGEESDSFQIEANLIASK